MTTLKPNHITQEYLKEGGIEVLVKDIKKVERYEMPPFKEFYHRILFKVYMKDGSSYEILRETVDKNGDFSIDSVVFETKEVRKGQVNRALEIRKMSGLSQAAFAEKYKIPKRTIENWEATTEAAKREAPEYVLDLLERAVKEEINGRKGKWIPYKYDKSAEKVWRECDQCNTAYQLFTTYDDYNGKHNIIPLKMNFCPNCGADMR